MLKHLIARSTKPKRVVILGSAGFVGTACTQRLRAMDIPVLDLPRTKLDLTDSKSGDLLADLLQPGDSLLFVAAKVSQYSYLPQGEIEAKERVVNMVNQMDKEGFGNCTNTGACEVECPKGISLEYIARMNREYISATIRSEQKK